MSVNTIEIMLNYIKERLEKSDRAKADDGITGKAFELGVRSYIMQRTANKVKPAGKTDITFTYNGKRYTCEIKKACGEIEKVKNNKYVIYCPYVDVNTPAEKQGYIMTREQWLTFLDSYDGRGKFTKIDDRGHLHIQSFYVSESVRPNASRPIANYIWKYMATLPTVEEFFNK